MNNRLKHSLNWKPHKILELIKKIYEISSIQFHDLRCALHGNRNYVLEESMKQHKVNAQDTWIKFSVSEKKNSLETCNTETTSPGQDEIVTSSLHRAASR